MRDELYTPRKAVIQRVIDEVPNVKSFVLAPEERMRFEAGQFVQLTLPGIGEAPFTPSSSPFVSESFELTVKKVGDVTNALHSLKEGVVGVRGPFGNGYPIEKFQGNDILVVGGGVGIAPLRALLLALFAERKKYRKITILYGAVTPNHIIFHDQLIRWSERANTSVYITVDVATKSWRGNVGVVPALFDKIKLNPRGFAAVCGPPVMMKFVVDRCLQAGFDQTRIYLSMERGMSCGIGKCGHCHLGKYYACIDGPVFTYDKVSDVLNLL